MFQGIEEKVCVSMYGLLKVDGSIRTGRRGLGWRGGGKGRTGGGWNMRDPGNRRGQGGEKRDNLL